MRTTEKVMWLAIGVAIGAGVALLYAPQSGKETRKFIRRKAEDARDTIAETGDTIMEAGRSAYRKSVDAATGVAETAGDLLTRAKAQVRG